MPYADLDKNLRSRLRAVTPPERWEGLVAGLAARKPQTLRANRLKAAPEDIERACADAGIGIIRVPELPDAYVLAEPRDIARLRESPLYAEGHVYSQGLSSQIPALCLSLAPGMRVLDATAAPGAKTAQLAGLMGGAGSIDACERDVVRFEKLLHTVRQQGAADMVACHRADAREYLAGLPADVRYDRILLDPPCSAMGRIWLELEKTYGYWKADLPSRHAKTQSSLLDACLARLAPGGTLVYSTCTLSTEENEWVLSHVLKRHPDCRIEPIAWTDALPEAVPGIGRSGDFVFREDVANARRFVPSARMEGFFVAKISKA